MADHKRYSEQRMISYKRQDEILIGGGVESALKISGLSIALTGLNVKSTTAS